jgi:DNA repair exonuclease SbcCD ATPase subunit
MFGLKNMANILGVPQDDAFAKPSSAPSTTSGYCDTKVVSGISNPTDAKDAKDAKENVEVMTKASIPFFPKQVSFLVPDDASDAEDYVDIPFVDDVETEELRQELASARQALKDVQKKLAMEKVETAKIQQDIQKKLATETAEKVKIQEELDEVQAKKDKVVNNLRTKRSLLLQVQARNVQLEEQLACEQSKHKVATDETESLRAGLMSVSASREDLKQKLKSRQESLKQARAEQVDLETKLAKVEGQHDMENELLTLLRKLAIHTGYFKWGKQIRVLESKISLAAEEAAAAATAAGNNAGGSSGSPRH